MEFHGDRSTPTTTKEMELRNRFKVVREAARQRSMDLWERTVEKMPEPERKAWMM